MAATKQLRSDEEIRSSVSLELKWDPKISSKDIGVAVKDAVASLNGFVPSYWEKEEAENAAWFAPGVTKVEDHITIAP
jgi:osmotically-inducible protein OsmY